MMTFTVRNLQGVTIKLCNETEFGTISEINSLLAKHVKTISTRYALNQCRLEALVDYKLQLKDSAIYAIINGCAEFITILQVLEGYDYAIEKINERIADLISSKY